ncbi:hypothetical protein VHEMI04491 [[Torrubiella] hemipterigena]|uniref:DUF3669 domain-containing protein n=1 Tax=[Torrubiella] hemipterigena TaxID=1531966 RepID=A0A0A1SVE8_9HYPO|nr:hypothetical protein VHEMI04491 [[Torrubiella] hemipterigena]
MGDTMGEESSDHLLRYFALHPDLLAHQPEDYNGASAMTEMLAIHRVIPARSLYRQMIKTGRPFRKIGQGTGGVVFGQEGTSFALKLAKSADTPQLWNDYRMHLDIKKAFENSQIARKTKIPACDKLVTKSYSKFFKKYPMLVAAAKRDCHTPTAVLITERIEPMPAPVRHGLISLYISPRNQVDAYMEKDNDDCLIRLYLGSMGGQEIKSTSIRNFELHLNQMHALGLNIDSYVNEMAAALAVMHWKAKTDARGVEFVLGASASEFTIFNETHRLEPLTLSRTDIEILFRPVINLWVLDFDQVQRITLDEDGVAKAVSAAEANNPYIPRPLQSSIVEKRAWTFFAVKYLQYSRMALNDKSMTYLPMLFLEGLIETEQKRQEQNVSTAAKK